MKTPVGPGSKAWEALHLGKMSQIKPQFWNHTDTTSATQGWDTLYAPLIAGHHHEDHHTPWRNVWFQAWDREGKRWAWSIMGCKKQGSAHRTMETHQKDTGAGWKGLPLAKFGIIWGSQWAMIVMDYNQKEISESTVILYAKVGGGKTLLYKGMPA